MISFLLSLFNPLSRILKSIDNNVDNETERERIKTGLIEKSMEAQVQNAGNPAWIIAALFFIIPFAFYFASVILYSIFFCQGCAYPKPWTIAELPPRFMEWGGWIMSSIFIYKGAEALGKIFRR